MIKLKVLILTFIITFVIVLLGGFYMHQSKYQMYVRVTPDSEEDSEWPSKKKWFNAAKWIEGSHFIKLNDTYVLNYKYKPIDELNDFRIARAIHRAIRKSIALEPELHHLANMDDDSFFDYLQDGVSFEYLRTQFDPDTLIPDNDYFLFSFICKGIGYEVEVLRVPYKDDFSFPYVGYVHKAGYWHSVSPAAYSYKDYRENKPLTN